MEEIIKKYESYLLDQYTSMNTIRSYMGDVRRFSNYFKSRDIVDITTPELMEYISELKKGNGNNGKKINPKSINRKISSLKIFYNWLENYEIIKTNNMDKIKFAKVQKNQSVVYMNLEESKEFLRTVHNEHNKVRCANFASLRDEWLTLTYLQTGLRATELINVKLDDIDIKKKEIKVIGKGNKIRYVAITDNNIALYKQYLAERETINIIDKDYVLLNIKGKQIGYHSIYMLIKQYAKESNLNNKLKATITPHKLRHSYASNMYKAGVDRKMISESMGHSNINTTMSLYVHLDTADVLDTTREVSNLLDNY